MPRSRRPFLAAWCPRFVPNGESQLLGPLRRPVVRGYHDPVCLMLGSQAKAEVMKGSQLLADCHDGDNPSARDSTYKGGTCSGYITAVADALVPAGLYCVPDQVKAGQVLDIVKL